jgi:hypothetical protein
VTEHARDSFLIRDPQVNDGLSPGGGRPLSAFSRLAADLSLPQTQNG